MTALKLLNEECVSETKTVTETTEHVQHMYIVGPFLQAETRNRNRSRVPETHY